MQMKLRRYVSVILALIMLFSCADLSFISYAATGDLGEGYNLELDSGEFATVDGEVVSTNSEGIVTILMFARTNGNCYNSNGTVGELCDAEWIQDERVRFLIIDIDREPLETVAQMNGMFGSDKAIFCYCENYAANNMMWDYAAAMWGESAGITLPLTVLIDSNNKVQYGFKGYQTADDLLPYVEYLVGEELAEKPKSVEFYVEGNFFEDEAFEVLEIVNEARAEQGLSALSMDKTLMEKAMQRAAECAVYYSHTRPDGSSCFDVLSGAYLYGCAENIAAGYPSSEAVMNGWLNSTGHYANIMGDYSGIGVGCFNHNGCTYWVQLFSVHTEQEKTQEENYSDTVIVRTRTDYFGEVTYQYAGDVEAGKKIVAEVQIENLGFAPFSPSFLNIVFLSSDESVLCVEDDGSLVGIAEGEATVEIYVQDVLLKTVPVVVKAGNGGGQGGNNPDIGTVVRGDATLNGVVDLEDANCALKFALGIGNAPSEAQLERADLNDTAGIDLDDANTILKIALGIEV